MHGFSKGCDVNFIALFVMRLFLIIVIFFFKVLILLMPLLKRRVIWDATTSLRRRILLRLLRVAVNGNALFLLVSLMLHLGRVCLLLLRLQNMHHWKCLLGSQYVLWYLRDIVVISSSVMMLVLLRGRTFKDVSFVAPLINFLHLGCQTVVFRILFEASPPLSKAWSQLEFPLWFLCFLVKLWHLGSVSGGSLMIFMLVVVVA